MVWCGGEGHLAPLSVLDKEVRMGKVRFSPDWSYDQHGDIRAGEQLLIEYDRSRFREPPEWIKLRQQAAGAHFYLRPERWPVTVYARFHPDGQEKAFPMESYGKSAERVLDMPIGTNKIELWFQFTVYWSECAAWDSRYGQNYWFDVTQDPDRFST